MRSEKEMLELILKTAREDERIRAVYMNGSRTNPNADKDIFQDYDVVFVVTETELFVADTHWVDRFGEVLYRQLPDECDRLMGHETNFSKCYSWLMQFKDGNRLDLHVEPAGNMDLNDTLCTILLDKDSALPQLPTSNDSAYHVKRPTDGEFAACCNEFYWCLNNVAKGLWRDELPYVLDMLNLCVRPQLVKMLSWKVGIINDFGVSVGKSGKYLKRYLTRDEYAQFLSTYCGGEAEEIKQSVFAMCGCFEGNAVAVADCLNFNYNYDETRASVGYLRHVINLPRDAKEVY